MTKVFVADVTRMGQLSDYEKFLSAYRLEKIAKLKNDKDKTLCAGVEILLAKYLGRKPNYLIDQNGKPCNESVEFNFSHSGDFAVCAVSTGKVGVDIQKFRPVNIEIANKRFCKNEYENIINSKDTEDKFFEYWVKKESFLKKSGTGIKGGLSTVDTDAVLDCKFSFYNIKGYKLCVCADDDAEFIEVDLSEYDW